MADITFTNVLALLKHYSRCNTDVRKSSFDQIDAFLKVNFCLLRTPSQFSKRSQNEEVIAAGSLDLRGQVLKVSETDCKEASQISGSFNLDNKEVLRIVALLKKTIPNQSLFHQCEHVLNERNSIIEVLLELINQQDYPVLTEKVIPDILQNSIDVIADLIELLDRVMLTFHDDNITEAQDINELRRMKDIIYVTNILKVVTSLSLNSQVPKELVLKWFSLLKNNRVFFDQVLNVTSGISDLAISVIESLFTVNSLLMLGLQTNTCSIDFTSQYFTDAAAFKQIHDWITQDINSPVLNYMWSFVLYVKCYLLTENPKETAPFIEQVFGDCSIKDITLSLAARAEEQNVLKSIESMAEALTTEKIYPVIITSMLTFSLNFVSLTAETSKTIKKVLIKTPADFTERFLTEKQLEKKTAVMNAKIPLIKDALLPLLNLSASNLDYADYQWSELSTYMTKKKLGELDYDIVDDATSSDVIVLKSEALVPPPLNIDQKSLLPIPKHTKAKIVGSTGPINDEAIIFMYKYNGWSVLGRILQNIADYYVDQRNNLDPDTFQLMITIIEVITRVIDEETRSNVTKDILAQLSMYVSHSDIISVILKLFEHSLHRRSYKVACTCMDFLNHMFPRYPNVLWSYLVRSDLLDKYGKSGLATTILGSIELANGDYRFTISLIELANKMVEESKASKTKAFSSTKADIMLRLTTHLLHIFESYQYWKYAKTIQRFRIGYHIQLLFIKVLSSVYGIDEDHLPHEKITGILAEPASRIIDTFLLPTTRDAHSVSALVNILLSPRNRELSLIGDEALGHIFNHLMDVTFFLTNLLLSVRSSLSLKSTSLEKRLLENIPKFVDIYEVSPLLRSEVIRLLDATVIAHWGEETPFLLSYFGETAARKFYAMLAFDLENELTNYTLLNDIHSFFGDVMESRQDGLSILLLSGVFITHETADLDMSTDRSILTLLKKNALHLNILPETVGSSLLNAVSCCMNRWTAASPEGDDEFIKVLISRVESFEPPKAIDNLNTQELAKAAQQYKLISKIFEIFSLYIYSGSTPQKLINEVLQKPDLDSFFKPFLAIDGYNKQLHKSLLEEFEKTWPNLRLLQFSLATGILTKDESVNYHYDIELLDHLLNKDSRWVGTDGFKNKLAKTTANTEFVVHQISAAKSLGALLTSYLSKADSSLGSPFVNILCDVLQVNVNDGIKSSLLIELYYERLELSFYILRSLQKANFKVDEKSLAIIFDRLILILRSHEVAYTTNIAQPMETSFYRPVLRSMLIVLSFAKGNPKFIETLSDQLLSFFELSFCKGANILISAISSDISKSNPSGNNTVVHYISDRIQDMSLLLALFKYLKNLKLSDEFNYVLASSLNEVGTLKAILNLYSNAHLYKLNGEAIFGPIMLNFISELCTIKEVSQKLLINGLFTVLLESPLSVVIQEGKTKVATESSLHSMWSGGLLSIVLLLLSQFGGKVLPECCLFVSYFSKQIKNAIYNWSDADLIVSTALIKETNQLILLQKILSLLDYKKYLLSSGFQNTIGSSEDDIELVIGLDNEEDRQDLDAALRRLLTHPKFLNSRVIPTTAEEQKLLADENTRTIFVKEMGEQIRSLRTYLMSKDLSE